MHTDRDVREALARVLAHVGAPAARGGPRYRSLGGGLGERSYVVSAGDRDWVVRLGAFGEGDLLDLAREAEIMAICAEAGLAPRVVGSDEGCGALITEYRSSARAWTAEDARRPENIERAAALLGALHRVSAPLPEFAPGHIARSYLADLVLGAGLRGWADELVELAEEYRSKYEASVVCHNDLVASNILDDGRLRLVDFEYAAYAAPVLDLANLAGMNDYDASQRSRLVAAYYAGGAAPFGAAEFDRVVRLVRLIALFWAVRNEQRATDRAPYAALRETLAEALE